MVFKSVPPKDLVKECKKILNLMHHVFLRKKAAPQNNNNDLVIMKSARTFEELTT
jgi:hypothetical protein